MKDEVVNMATKSFTTVHKFNQKSATKLLKAFETASEKDEAVLSPPTQVNYIRRNDKEAFDKFLNKTIRK